MHHLYPLAKGDPLCPLGFHPQVRWPTRCKRCFRDYKEHGGRGSRQDDFASTPSLSHQSPASRGRDEDSGAGTDRGARGWASSSNLSNQDSPKKDSFGSGFSRVSSTWTSTPDLGDADKDSNNAVTVSLKLPRRKLTGPIPTLDTGQPSAPKESATITLRRPSASPPPTPPHLTINKNDSLAERVKKMQLLKAQSLSFEKESNEEKERERRSASRSKEEERPARSKEEPKPKPKEETKAVKDDVNFLMQVKSRTPLSKPPARGGPAPRDDDDDVSTATTEGTLVDANVREYQDQIESLKNEVDTLKKRCERVEKEKSDILLRRLANIDTANKYTTGRTSEVLKLQQKVNELTAQNEDLRDEKKHLTLKVKEVEADLESRSSGEAAKRECAALRAKLVAAETLCEELMDENEDMKKELRDLEEEIEEMHDNFREDQADEYSSLRRELEQTIKNCRVLSFKLKKTERKADQLEAEKRDQEKKLLEIVGGQAGLDRVNRIKELEQEVSRSNEVALRLQRELADATARLSAADGNKPANQKRQTMVEGKISRSSLTRGGSQDDPAQLLRDLQDSLEREADLREQLRNSEDEANNLRKTASRVEDDNESLLLQLKKMATKARSRKLSPTPPSNRLAIEAPNEKDEGISDEEDPAELRLLLELNEQEAAVLRRKAEEIEQDRDSLKKQVKELTEKIAATKTKPAATTVGLKRNTAGKAGNLAEEKVKVLEDEIAELRKKFIEKERDCERLHTELSLTHKKPKASLIKSKSLDGPGEQKSVDLSRQLQVIEQEASVLRARTQSLEADNERLLHENNKLQLMKNTKQLKSEKSFEQSTEKISQLEKELQEALAKVKELEAGKEKEDKGEKKVRFGDFSKRDADALKMKQDELDRLKLNLTKLEKENSRLQSTLKSLKEDAIKSFKPRTPKKLTDMTTKLQMKRMVEDLESEIGELYVVMKNAGLSGKSISAQEQLEKDIEEAKSKLTRNESEFTNEKNRLQTEIAKLKDLNVKLETNKSNVEDKCKTLEEEKNKVTSELKTFKEEKKKLETQVTKLTNEIKSSTSQQTKVSESTKKIEELKKEIEVKDKKIEDLKKQVENAKKLEDNIKKHEENAKKLEETVKKLEENVKKLEQNEKKLEEDKSKLLKEVGDKTKKINDLEKKLKEADERYKRAEKQLTTRKERVAKLEKEEEALRETSNQKYDEAFSSVEMSQMKEKLESTARDLEEKQDELENAKRDLTKVENELSAIQNETTILKSDLAKAENERKDLETKLQAEKKDSAYWESKASEFETDIQAERKKVERMRIAHDKDIKNKEAELATLKGKLKVLEQSSGAGMKRIGELKQEHEENVKKLEHSLAVERAEYEELTGKYEMLEEEHVVTKARLTVEKEQAQSELMNIQKELNATLEELKTAQDSYDTDSAKWEKEKAELQTELSSLQSRLCGGGWEVQKARLSARLEQAERDLAESRERCAVLEHQRDSTGKELEESRQKLEDYEKVCSVQRNLAADNNRLEREAAELRSSLEAAEQARRNELASAQLRSSAQQDTLREELASVQQQVTRFKRERDNYKQMLESAQKSLAEERAGARVKRHSISSTDEEEYRSKLAALEQQVLCLEDELSESRLTASRLHTELVGERAAAQLQHAEMTSRLNEYEEERLLSSGRARVAGTGTRMELAWTRERDEQQRLLAETSTLARDLRQTLHEVERERDKERLDMKRRIEQIKRTTEEETEEAKKKVSELQCDLLELRDAHAKLRTASEKHRRERERTEREREQHRMLVTALKRAQQEDDRRITQLLETIEELMQQSPALFPPAAAAPPEKRLTTPTPPRRNRSSKSRSREATPEAVAAEGAAATVARLQKLTDELRASRIAERQRRHQANARRAISTEPRDTLAVPQTRTPTRAPSLKKRSVSLEQTTKEQNVIWKSVDDSSVSSLQSLEQEQDLRVFGVARDNSLDSRLSGGSAQSDVLPEKKKKKSIFGKLKKLTKSRSIDDQAGPDEFRPIGTVSQGSDSDMSAAGSRRDLRGRISDMFHRKGTLSRGNSKEQTPERAASALGVVSATATLPRNASSATLAREPAPSSRPASRAASATPAVKRKGK